MMKQTILTLVILIYGFLTTFAQEKELDYSNKLTIVTGITQPLLLNGYNLAVSYTTNKWVFEYSHGMSLDYTEILNSDYKDNVLGIKSPYSTGAGVGYRFFANRVVGMDLRVEAKVHGYEVQLNESQSIDYTNYDLGGGIYWQIRPFGKRSDFLRGIVIEPSIRYWANAGSSLEDNFEYRTTNDQIVVHEPYPLNLFANISVGYTFVSKY